MRQDLHDPSATDHSRRSGGAPRRYWAAPGGLLCLVAALASCSPYVNPEVPRPGLLRNDRGDIELDAEHRMIPLHVTTAEAREYARLLQDAYRCKLREMSATRTSTNAALISTAAAAIGIAATGGATAAVTALGLGGASMAAMGQQLVVSVRRTIYSQGGLALECVINAANTNVAPDAGAARVRAAQANVLEATRRLRTWIRYAERLRRPEQCRTQERDLEQAIGSAHQTSVLAEASAQGATASLDALDPLGPILLSAVENIRLRVDEELAKAEPDLLQFNQALKDQLQTSATAFGAKTTDEQGGDGGKNRALARAERATAEASAQLATLLATIPDECREMVTVAVDLDNASLAALAATTALADTIVLARARPPVPADIFTNCSLIRPIGAGPLRIDPSSVEVPRGSGAQLLVAVSGGRKPYQKVPDVSPANVAVTFGTSTENSQLMSVNIPSSETASVRQFVIAVRDGDGTTALVLVKVVAAAAAGGAAGSPAAERHADAVWAPRPTMPPYPDDTPIAAEDALLEEAEVILVNNAADYPHLVLGEADGRWVSETREAAEIYIQERLTMEEMPDDFDSVEDDRLATLVIAAHARAQARTE